MIALTSVDLLILDDFALEPMTKEESKDVYQLFLERTGRGSMIISSNRDTSEWLAMFDDLLLAQSAVDRFKNAAYDFVIDGESYRPRQKPTLDTADPPPETRRRKHDCIRAPAHAANGNVSPPGRGLLDSSPRPRWPHPPAKTRKPGLFETRNSTHRRRIRFEALSIPVAQHVPWPHPPAKRVAPWPCEPAKGGLSSASPGRARLHHADPVTLRYTPLHNGETRV